jgi:feruloyl esterase
MLATLSRKLPFGFSLALLLLLLAPGKALAADCAAMRNLRLPHVEIILATPVEGTFNEDTAAERAGRTYYNLPKFCRIRGISRPVAGSEIGFEIWMPVDNWTGRIHMVGNGAYHSNIHYMEMAPRLKEGDVAVGTNAGHSGTNLKFGWRNPQKIADFGYRAVHESIVAAKTVVAAYYGRAARWSYFAGCSTGGMQAMSETQRYPEDFDGVIAGAPGNNRSALTMSFLWAYLANHRAGQDDKPILSLNDLLLLNRAIIAGCDDVDGVHDGVIADPRRCRFRTASLLCRKDSAPGTCLTGEQIAAADKIYAGPKDSRTGRQIYPGLTLGSEGVRADAKDSTPGWTDFLAGDRPTEPARADIFRYWVYDDPQWNWWKFDWGKDVDRVTATLGPLFDANNPDISRFAARGGKLMMYIGWQDPIGSAGEAINYYQAVEDLQRGATTDQRRAAAQRFLRLFMVPGMAHCSGGPGATNKSSSEMGSTPPASDRAHDMTRAIEAWVEKGQAPTQIIATRYVAEVPEADKPKTPIAFQRPLCVYPQVAIYRGGPTNLASSFICKTPAVSTVTRLSLTNK